MSDPLDPPDDNPDRDGCEDCHAPLDRCACPCRHCGMRPCACDDIGPEPPLPIVAYMERGR